MTMSIDIDTLLEQEEVSLKPTQGRFDPKAIGQFIQTLGAAWQDPQRPAIFLVFLSADARDSFVSTYDPTGPRDYPYVLLIDVSEEQVYINQFAGDRFAALSAQFMRWLTSAYSCEEDNAED